MFIIITCLLQILVYKKKKDNMNTIPFHWCSIKLFFLFFGWSWHDLPRNKKSFDKLRYKKWKIAKCIHINIIFHNMYNFLRPSNLSYPQLFFSPIQQKTHTPFPPNCLNVLVYISWHTFVCTFVQERKDVTLSNLENQGNCICCSNTIVIHLFEFICFRFLVWYNIGIFLNKQNMF